MFTQVDHFKNEIASLISTKVTKTFSIQLGPEKIYSLLGTPPTKEAGDIAFPLFILAKEVKSNPALAAKKLQESFDLLPKFILKIEAQGPYLNFFLNFDEVAKVLLPEIIQGDFFKRKLSVNTPKTMIEFSQPNTHKELHVGHMRNLCLGDSLIRLHRYCGFDIISSTFPGDVGTHVAKCLWYLKFHYQGEIPKDRKGAWLGTLYSSAHNKLEEERGTEKEEKNREQLTLILKQLEKKEGEYFDLWKTTREWSIELMKKIYEWAGVHFDVWYWESEVDSDSVKLARDYQKKGLFKEDQGCVGVDLSEYKLGFCMLLKTDGNGLYATKDIELARRKFQDFKIEKNIYVVDKRQEHHFKQVFKVLELMGFENASKCFHLQYDFVELPDGAMSSRKGNIVPLESLIENMVKMIKEKYLNRYKNEWSDHQIEDTAQIVAKGAIKYGMTKIDPNKKIVFDMEEWLKLDGESGPYAQYAYARINSMLIKLGRSESCDFKLETDQEKNLVSVLMNFNTIAQQATEHYRPSLLTAYLYDLGRAYNSFYADCPVASSTGVTRETRLALSESTALVMKKGLELLGIEAPERM
jgi:arginyl-tRNA synthetase